MSKPTLLDMLAEMRTPELNLLESKGDYSYSGTNTNVKLKNEKSGKNRVLKNDEAKDFHSQLESFQKKMKGSNGTFDKFVVTYGYDELLESEDYKYKKPLKDNKENEMSKTSKKESLKAAQKSKESKADDSSENEEDLDEATRYQRELAEKDNPFAKKDKSDDDDDGGKSEKDDDDDDDTDKGDDKSEKDDGKLTDDDDDDKSEKDDDDDDDDEEEEMDEGLSLDDIIQEEIDAVSIDVSEILEELGEGQDAITEEEKVLFLKMAKLMENRLKLSIKKTGDRMVDVMEDCNVEFQEWLTDKMDKFTSKVINEWKAENHVAVQTNAKATLNENVVTQILTVLEDNNINITEKDVSKVEVMEATLRERDETVSTISDELLESAQEVEKLQKALIRKDFVIEDTDKRDIFDSLLEDVEYTNDKDYSNRLTVLYKKYITEDKSDNTSDDGDNADVLSLVEDIHMFEDIDFDTDSLLDEAKGNVVKHPSGRVSTLLESLKR